MEISFPLLNAALLLSASCLTTMGVLVHHILLVAATLLCWNVQMIGEVQEKGVTAAVVWTCPDNIHGIVDGALEKWVMSGEFGPVQKWWVGTTAEGLLYHNRR